MTIEFADISEEVSAPAPYRAPYNFDTDVKNVNTDFTRRPQDENTKNAMAVAGMNSEMDRWTQADAPDLFEKGMDR